MIIQSSSTCVPKAEPGEEVECSSNVWGVLALGEEKGKEKGPAENQHMCGMLDSLPWVERERCTELALCMQCWAHWLVNLSENQAT